MNNPVVLDGDRTCYNCANHALCHGRNLTWDFMLHDWNAHMDTNKSSLLMNALATACRSFDFQPDPPMDDDEKEPPVTVILQVSADAPIERVISKIALLDHTGNVKVVS